ncbi:hypothetical protein QBC46DRAFT_347479 [Diplogelasinospora grovesii]|uniref:Uncharacterized protein n=1 Tax=Diplogelasinospora grovesii TaxID=303347 RepID=A0AAN6MW46_9PEZI|nr:hypothetical protein QBC46DRAFT_347479 [Diplogelasinospora grovesii]
MARPLPPYNGLLPTSTCTAGMSPTHSEPLPPYTEFPPTRTYSEPLRVYDMTEVKKDSLWTRAFNSIRRRFTSKDLTAVYQECPCPECKQARRTQTSDESEFPGCKRRKLGIFQRGVQGLKIKVPQNTNIRGRPDDSHLDPDPIYDDHSPESPHPGPHPGIAPSNSSHNSENSERDTVTIWIGPNTYRELNLAAELEDQPQSASDSPSNYSENSSLEEPRRYVPVPVHRQSVSMSVSELSQESERGQGQARWSVSADSRAERQEWEQGRGHGQEREPEETEKDWVGPESPFHQSQHRMTTEDHVRDDDPFHKYDWSRDETDALRDEARLRRQAHYGHDYDEPGAIVHKGIIHPSPVRPGPLNVSRSLEMMEDPFCDFDWSHEDPDAYSQPWEKEREEYRPYRPQYQYGRE